MSFLLTCPNCGKRPVGEFSFRGEVAPRPPADADWDEWADHVFMATNRRGPQTEWWLHASGCRRWFVARRDTTASTAHESSWFAERGRLE